MGPVSVIVAGFTFIIFGVITMAFGKKPAPAYAPPGGSMPFNNGPASESPAMGPSVSTPMAKTKVTPKTKLNALPKHAMHARGRNRGMK